MASKGVSRQIESLRAERDSAESEIEQLRRDREQLTRVLDDTAEKLRQSQRALHRAESILHGLPAHHLWRLLATCIQQQRDGADVMASAYWDDVVKCWEEMEKA